MGGAERREANLWRGLPSRYTRPTRGPLHRTHSIRFSISISNSESSIVLSQEVSRACKSSCEMETSGEGKNCEPGYVGESGPQGALPACVFASDQRVTSAYCGGATWQTVLNTAPLRLYGVNAVLAEVLCNM